MALVPPTPSSGGKQSSSRKLHRVGDTFYPPLADLAQKVNAKVMVLEVGGTEQALRVANMVCGSSGTAWHAYEVWHDEWDGVRSIQRDGRFEERGKRLLINHFGLGHGRAVVCWRGDGGMPMGTEE